MNNGAYPWYLTWPVIIVAFFVFWPAALILIYLRTKNSKQGMFAAATNKKVYIVVGAILIVIGITNIGDSFGTALFFIVGGGAIIYYANSLAKKASRNKSYINLIVNQGETSIDKIASQLNVKYDVALRELKTLQTLGVLKGVSVDESQHNLVLEKAKSSVSEIADMVNSVTNVITGASSVDAAETKKTVQMACPGCGAKYTGTEGSTQVCDYCDTNFIFR